MWYVIHKTSVYHVHIFLFFQDEEKDEKKTEKKTEEKKDDKKADDKKAGTSSTDEKKKDDKEEKKKEPEPNFEILQNPARVLRQQLKVIALNENSQYVPMKDVTIGGIVMVRNLKPGEEELVEPVAGKLFTRTRKKIIINPTVFQLLDQREIGRAHV